MKFKALIGVIGLLSVLTGNAVLAQPNQYNDGFIAAESGNYRAAIAAWRPLAEQGHAVAQFNLALLYHRGLGVEIDEQKAVGLYHQSADNGYHKAQQFLAAGYREGWFGLPVDPKKAEFWLKQLGE